MKLTLHFLKGVYITMCAILLFNSGFAQVLIALPAEQALPQDTIEAQPIADQAEVLTADLPQGATAEAISLEAVPTEDVVVPVDPQVAPTKSVFKDTPFSHYTKLTKKF